MILATLLAWALQNGREMSTDRPDKTESPGTVDAGRVQLEMDLVVGSRDRVTAGDDRTLTSSHGFGRFNLRFGATEDLELDLQMDPYDTTQSHDRATGEVTRQDGFGDTALRAKINLAGNDGGSPGLALLPFISFPTHHGDPDSRAVQGGLIVPVSFDLPLDFSLGAMTELDAVRFDKHRPYDAVFVNSLTLGHAIVGGLEGYGEFASEVVARQGHPWIGTVDTGLLFKVSENVQLDGGVNFGVTRAAIDREYFAGLSWRF